MKSTICYINYELLPEYTEKSQLTDLFTEHKFLGWLGLLIIFLLISSVLYFQLKIWDNEDKLENKRINDRKEREFKTKK
tara:strand:- start:230 stop:466 length:237 start_codon:yes stop_codon:yes gene_type:complete